MKKLALYFGLILMAAACSSNDTDAPVVKEVVANDKVSFSIEGMTCEVGCAKRIVSKLDKMEGVQSSSIDFESKVATVNFDNSITSKQEFIEMIESLNDKQYKVVEGSNSNASIEDKKSTEESFHSVISGNSFELPNLLDLFTNII